jgi:hypothetical protein
MATVADLVTLLDVKLLGFASALTPAGLDPSTENLARKIAVLNESYHTVWRVLVGLEKEFESYWFTKRVTSLSAGGGLVRDFNLPSDFHDMLYIEVASPDASRVIHFERAGFNTLAFISERQQTANVAPTTLPDEKVIHYVTARGNPSRLHLGRSFATGTTLSYIYTYFLADLTGSGDSIDDLMTPYQGPVTSCAAAVLLNAVHESGLAQGWESRYERDVASMRGAAAEGRPPSEGLRKELA